MNRRLAAALLTLLPLSAAALSHQSIEKLDASLLSKARALNSNERIEMIVRLSQQSDLSAIDQNLAFEDKVTRVVNQLKQTAALSQQPLLDQLKERKVPVRSFWLVNAISVQADVALIDWLAARDDVAHFHANPKVQAKLPEIEPLPLFGVPATGAWGLTKTQAPWVWAEGVTGQGVVIAGADTGYKWDHPALINAYRGKTPSGVDHNYNWHSAFVSTSGGCIGTLAAPCDDNTHGSHTMGTMVGLDGNTAYGMAPDAKWIGCRNMNNGIGTPESYLDCFQFFLAPTDLNGTNPNPRLAPHITSNSWGCPPSEGCTDPTVLQLAVQNTRAAGIFQSMAAGNSGSACSSVVDPPAIYPEVFTVGNTTSTDGISGSSSRGPSFVGANSYAKPEISAPGSSILSANRNGGYSTLSGTSMAAPHVAGLAALLMSADPSLKGQPARVETIIRRTATVLFSAQSCGGVPGSLSPNNTFGAGRIDAKAAVIDAVTVFKDGFGA
jgi:serine protease AprX